MAQKGTAISAEEYAAEEELLRGVPRFNIAAFFAPPIWGPAHGIWATILFYPIWVFADDMFVSAFVERTPMSIALAGLVFIVLAVITVAFAVASQPLALHRALKMGVSKETYLKRQRIWAVVSVVIGVAALAIATFYNLTLNPAIVG